MVHCLLAIIFMIKRPLNSQFREKVLCGEKTTTIRDKAWPVGVPIMLYAYGRVNPQPIHETEGFESRAEMDAWFRSLIKQGEPVEKTLMLFRLANAEL